MAVHNLVPADLVAIAERNIDEADKILNEISHYSGKYQQFQTEVSFAQGLYASAQAYIALAEYKRKVR